MGRGEGDQRGGLDMTSSVHGAGGQSFSSLAVELEDNAVSVVDMQAIRLTPMQCVQLFKIMKGNTSVHTLLCNDNPLEDAGATSLAEVLDSNPNLTVLDLSHTSVGVSGAAALARGVRKAKGLQELYLGQSGRWANAMGAKAFAEEADQTFLSRSSPRELFSCTLLEKCLPPLLPGRTWSLPGGLRGQRSPCGWASPSAPSCAPRKRQRPAFRRRPPLV